ncbi:hypothetical protein JYQ62_21050 [Nostoc sp. UHCC 0702]|nr:hypothetical protein JYQ62_21050 [Nostoc sp. UHCC 0702]
MRNRIYTGKTRLRGLKTLILASPRRRSRLCLAANGIPPGFIFNSVLGAIALSERMFVKYCD